MSTTELVADTTAMIRTEGGVNGGHNFGSRDEFFQSAETFVFSVVLERAESLLNPVVDHELEVAIKQLHFQLFDSIEIFLFGHDNLLRGFDRGGGGFGKDKTQKICP